MKIVFLGVGKEGKTAIKDLVESGFQEMTLCDYRIDEAKAVAESYEEKDTDISAKQVDANNPSDLVEVMKGADIVANTIGPFYKFGSKILKASIEAGVDFIDICDDPEPMREELKLNEEAKERGVTAVVGCGNNPGTGNICAKYGAGKLDSVEEINIYWLHPSDSETSSASLGHALDIFSGKVTTYEEGEWKEVSTSFGFEEVEFPEAVGTAEVYHCGHPEPITIPKYIEGVNKVTCKGGVTPVWANKDLRKFIDYGLTSSEPIEVKGTQVVPREFTEAFLKSFTDDVEGEQGEKASRVVVRGEKNGKTTTYIYDRMGRSWTAGISLSVGIQIMAENDTRNGVFSPEGELDPEIFLKELSKRGLEVREKVVSEGNAV